MNKKVRIKVGKNATATFTKEPSPELLKVVKKMVKLARKQVKN
jgi:hypothetical protein